MDTIEIGLSDLEPIELNLSSPLPASSSGSTSMPGIELLMNDTHKSRNSGPTSIDLGELDTLEKELNDLSGHSSNGQTKTIQSNSGSSMFGGLGKMFGFGGSEGTANVQTATNTTDSRLGTATVENMGSAKTWDGYTKVGDIPAPTSASRLTDREKNRKKRLMLSKLEEWYQKGHIKNSTQCNSDSSYEDIEDEYETAMEDKRRRDAVKMYGWWFTTFVNSVEYANASFDPFGLNLDGWGESVGEDLDSYDELFGELYERYKGGKLMPEVSLLLRLGFSAAMTNFTNKALSSATPGFNDVIRQSPELMRAFTNATASAMSQTSPGFAAAANMFGPNSNQAQGPSANMGPPPAPQDPRTAPAPQRTMADMPSMRPDMAMARGIDINNQYQSMSEPVKTIHTPQFRPEMKGPQNSSVDSILAGLKPKTPAPSMPPVDFEDAPSFNMSLENDSMVSISSLKDMAGASMPKRSQRRGQGKTNSGSARNTISLDI